MLILCLQLCPFDQDEAIQLAQLIADVEPTRRSDVEFLVAYRRDTDPLAIKEITEILSKKFTKVHSLRGTGRGTGWPTGCNELWAEVTDRIEGLKRSGKLSGRWTLTFEADCVMLRPNWIDLLIDACKDGDKAGKWVVGHAHYFPKPGFTFEDPDCQLEDEPNHINGNALFKVGVRAKNPWLNGGSATAGWDAFHGKKILRIGMDTNLIAQQYRMKGITREKLEGIRKRGVIPALFHGIKKSAAIPIVREMIADGSFARRKTDTFPY